MEVSRQNTPFWKRCLDLAAILLLLPFTLPVGMVVAAVVALASPGPIFYRQLRAGQGGKPFTILKFRTMVVGAESQQDELAPFNEQEGPIFKMEQDPRATPMGHVLRRSGLDELPQFWNVLCGEMSLVGPRPLPLDEQKHCTQWPERLAVKPGVTGPWQVRRGPVGFEEWMNLERDYALAQNLLLDLRLILETPVVMLGRTLGIWR